MKSAKLPVMRPNIGKNIPEIEVVARTIGTNKSRVETAAAYQREWPCANRSLYPSITMTESSTTIPNTTISAARVTVFNSIPKRYMIPIVMAMQTGKPVELTRAVRNGKRTSMTAMTMSTETTRSLRNDRTLLSTTRGWSVILCIWTSGGNVARICSNISSTLAPNATMLLPDCISILSSRQSPTPCSS